MEMKAEKEEKEPEREKDWKLRRRAKAIHSAAPAADMSSTIFHLAEGKFPFHELVFVSRGRMQLVSEAEREFNGKVHARSSLHVPRRSHMHTSRSLACSSFVVFYASCIKYASAHEM
jgi:hypothetical protein